jgi:hypothetical protein
MAVNSGPRINPSDVAVTIDMADPNCIRQYSSINSSTWTVSTGGVTNYSINGGTSENSRFVATDPFGNQRIVWEAQPSGDGGADGGWETAWFLVDQSKTYRFSMWVMRTSSTSGGSYYLGLYGINSAGSNFGIILPNGNVETNYYWQCVGTSALTQNVWYLIVGHVKPFGSTAGLDPRSGVYTQDGGKITDIGYCGNGGDARWQNGTVYALHRAYLYYCGDNTTRIRWFDPRVDLVDGTEPSISELLYDPPGPSEMVSKVTNSVTISGNNTALNVNAGFLDCSTNSYLIVDTPANYASNQRTFEMWVKMNGSNATYMPIAVMTNASSITNGERFWLGVQNSRAQWHGWGSDDPQGSTVITDNIWHHVVFSYDNSSKLMKVYTDGVLENTTTNVGEGANIAASANQKWYLGGDPLGTTWTGGASNNFNGQIGAFKQYNRILDDYEVTQLFNIHSPRFGRTPRLIGTTPDNPAARSTDILAANPSAATGWYWIAAGNDVGRFWVDMTYSGGGWVLVMNNRSGNGGVNNLTYVDATKKVINFRSTSSTSPGVNYGNHYTPNNFNLWVGLDAWKSIIDANSSFKKIAYFVSTSYQTLGSTSSHTYRSSWSWTGWSSTYAMQGASSLSNEVGGVTPGWYGYHIANGFSLTTYDLDQDTNGGNCATYYNNNPFWYGSCWDGNFFAGGGYNDKPNWNGAGTNEHNYGAVYIK